jgi:hypothetical protein
VTENPQSIALASDDPFVRACLWDRRTDLLTDERVVSFSMLTMNVDELPVMKQFHKPIDKKCSPVIITLEWRAA